MTSIRVLIVDDHTIVRRGLQSLFLYEDDFQIVGEAGNGEDAISLARELNPDVILMDLAMPKMGGIEAAARIHASQPKIGILVVTSFVDEDNLLAAVRAGARGFLLKDTLPEELLRSIREIADGKTILPPDLAWKVIQEMSVEREAAPVESLTEREKEVLAHIANGWTNRMIAEKMSISEGTVRTHTSNLMQKLGLENRSQLALYGVKHRFGAEH